MLRTPRDAFLFVAGLWLCLTLLGPLTTPWAWAADPDMARLEAALYRGVNGFRAEHHLISLERRADLDAVARAHCKDMIARGYFAHETPEGLNWVDRLHGADVQGFTLAGENVAQTSRASAKDEILNGWQASPAHRRNLLARPYNATGIGAARAPDGRVFAVQLYVTYPR